MHADPPLPGPGPAPVPATDAERLVDRRAQLLAGRQPSGAELALVTRQLRAVLDECELEVRRVTLEDSRDLAERLGRDEPVHPVTGTDDLADRLDSDRRCFVIEHPSLPSRPLNVVWVALCRGITGDLASILDPAAPIDDPSAADTAVFYSIWNVEPGLVGLGRGEELLVRSIEHLRVELPTLTTFVTLSPIPDFGRWMERHHPDDAPADQFDDGLEPLADVPDGQNERLVQLCAEYLTTLRDGWRPIDPVARFHLGNGARLVGVNWAGDRSRRGFDRSFGLMANYRYEPEDREANQAALGSGTVPVSDDVAVLLLTDAPTDAPASH